MSAQTDNFEGALEAGPFLHRELTVEHLKAVVHGMITLHPESAAVKVELIREGQDDEAVIFTAGTRR